MVSMNHFSLLFFLSHLLIQFFKEEPCYSDVDVDSWVQQYIVTSLGCGQRCNSLVLSYSLMKPSYKLTLTRIQISTTHSRKGNHTSFSSVLFILFQNLSLIILLPTQHTVNCHQRQDPYESCIGVLVHYAQTRKKAAFQSHKSCTNQIALYTYATQDQQYIVSNSCLIPFLTTIAKRLCLRSNKVLYSQSFQSLAFAFFFTVDNSSKLFPLTLISKGNIKLFTSIEILGNFCLFLKT